MRDVAAALPPEFRWMPAWIEPGEAGRLLDILLAETPWEDHALTIAGRQIPLPRRVAYFGPFPYVYSGIVHPARPLPPLIAALRDRIQEVAAQPFNTVLMNLYRSGTDSVSWHSDDDYPHGGHPAVASLSLGAARRFRIAHKRRSGERYGLDLTAGGLLIMGGTSQVAYRHALPKSPKQHGARINLTFRHMAASNA
ncbi:MAG TPA: alpha-ketoglutarate-dependent dioxygenase AlkB [Myxococcaceae bacterium]|nr:alpha-ketoglutarate-dependent dioxygenase AlkB [Myxococcaceae bacterium]